MEILSPAPTEDHNEQPTPQKPSPQPTSEKEPKTPLPQYNASLIGSPTSFDDVTFLIETHLYIASISSAAGGTIRDFKTKNYFNADSQYINLILPGETPNLLIEATDLDGGSIDLRSPWKLSSPPPGRFIKETTSLTFKKEVFKSRYIKKTLLINPNNYTIRVDLDLSEISNNIYRDVSFGWYGGLASTENNTVDDHSYFKAFTYTGGELEELKSKPGEAQAKEYSGESSWTAIRTKYFTTSLIPSDPTEIRKSVLSTTADSLEVYSAKFVLDANTNPSFTLFLGPLEYERIKALNVGLDSIMDFGWSFIRPISKGVLYMLKKMHEHIPNYGFVLIVFAFLVKLLVYPLTKKSYQSTTAMQAIQPQVNAIREKHKSNPTKMNQATMALYKEKGVNPLGGCLPMLLQMPLLFALFIVFRTTIELRAEPFVWWVKDLSSPDVIFYLPFTIPIYGGHVAALPILMVISMFIQQKMMMTGGAQQAQQKTMQYFMTAFFFLIFNSFPSGLNLYYTLFNVLTIAQQKLVPTDNKDKA